MSAASFNTFGAKPKSRGTGGIVNASVIIIVNYDRSMFTVHATGENDREKESEARKGLTKF
jgi:hypothetical protein